MYIFWTLVFGTMWHRRIANILHLFCYGCQACSFTYIFELHKVLKVLFYSLYSCKFVHIFYPPFLVFLTVFYIFMSISGIIFHLPKYISFSFPLSADLLKMIRLSVCFLKAFSCSSQEGISAGYRILGWPFFPFSLSKGCPFVFWLLFLEWRPQLPALHVYWFGVRSCTL